MNRSPCLFGLLLAGAMMFASLRADDVGPANTAGRVMPVVMTMATSAVASATAAGKATADVEVPSFYLREVTSSRPNQAICLVCRYGARPTVLVCCRGLNEQTERLLVKLDRVVDARRAQGLRGFAMFLDATKDLQPKLFNVARRDRLSLPLGFPVETSGPRGLELSEKAEVTVLLYRRKKVAQRFTFAADELSDKAIERLVAATEKFADE